MLALARAENESIILRIDGRRIAKIAFIAMQSGKARIGLEAGQEVEIHREEIDRQKYPDDYPPPRRSACH